MSRTFLKRVKKIPAKAGLSLIWLYQKTLSPDHSWFKHRFPHGYCKFYPTCSVYTADAIRQFGLIRGSLVGLWRIIRCNPFSKGGVDNVKK